MDGLKAKLKALSAVGTPYGQISIDSAPSLAKEQAAYIVKDLDANGVQVAEDSEMVALIAYLQRLGTDVSAAK